MEATHGGDGDRTVSRSIDEGGIAEKEVIREKKESEDFVDASGKEMPVVNGEEEDNLPPEEAIPRREQGNSPAPVAVASNEDVNGGVVDKEVSFDQDGQSTEAIGNDSAEAGVEVIAKDEKEANLADEHQEQVPVAENKEFDVAKENLPVDEKEETAKEQVPVENTEAAQVTAEETKKAAAVETEAKLPHEGHEQEAPVEEKGAEAAIPAHEDQKDEQVGEVEMEVPVIDKLDGPSPSASADKLASEEDKPAVPREQVVEANEDHKSTSRDLEPTKLDGLRADKAEAPPVAAGDEITAESIVPDAQAAATSELDSDPPCNGGGSIKRKTKSGITGLLSRCFPEFDRFDSHSWTSGLALGIIVACTAVVISKNLRNLKASAQSGST